ELAKGDWGDEELRVLLVLLRQGRFDGALGVAAGD
ncbi:hypothetical protein L195_g048283, partial [Trifolium pratense]